MVVESCGEYSFKEFANVAKQADWSVIGWLLGVFAGFLDHYNYCYFPWLWEVASGDAYGE